jgi:UDP-glucose 4-epimerase
VPGSAHSRQKAYAERALDALEARVPDLRVVRLRPGLVLQRAAGSSIRRLLLGPLVPGWLLRRG